MEIRQLKTFRAVATLGSFNKAAEQLFYAQSTVSEQIKALESDLDVKLFKQVGKKVSLTEAGEALLQYAQKIINLEEEIRTEIKECKEVYGSLSIRIPETISTYYLPPILNKFKSSFPRVNLHLTSCSSHGLNEELRSGIINLAFLITKNYQEVDLDIYSLGKIPLVLVTYPSNPVAAKRDVKLAELKNDPIFVTSSDCNYFKILEELFYNERTKMSALYHSNSLEAIKRNIIGGTGAALLPEIAVNEELSKGSLVEIKLEKGPLSAGIVMIRLKNKWHPPILEALMDVVKNAFVLPADNSNLKVEPVVK